MPTVLRMEGFRFFFFSNEHAPEHIHIEKGEMYARVELETLRVTESYNISSKDLKKIVELVKNNKEILQKEWYEYFE